MLTHRTVSISAVFALVASAGLAHAQCGIQTILPPDRAIGDTAGAAIGTSNGTIAVGAPLDDNFRGSNAGIVWILQPSQNGYTQLASLTDNAGQPNHLFGSALSFRGDYLAVGASGGNRAVIKWRNSGGWQERKVVAAPDVQPGDWVGSAVTLNEGATLAAFGAPGRDHSAQMADTGAVLVYRRNEIFWEQEAVLADPSSAFRAANDRLGTSLAMTGDRLFVGVPGGDVTGMADAGRVIVYNRLSPGNWSFTRLHAPDGAAGDRFGQSVAAATGYFVVGAPGVDNLFTSNVGAVYIYRHTMANNTYTLEARIVCPDMVTDAGFGDTVSLSTSDGDVVAVTAPGARRAYAFRRTSDGEWTRVGTFTDPHNPHMGDFARTVHVDGKLVYVGDPGGNENDVTVGGAIYRFGTPGAGSDFPAGATRAFLGTTDICTNHFTLDSTTTCGNQMPQGPDAWLRYIPHANGTVTIDTVGSNFDTILSVHSAMPGTAANTLVCNDDHTSAHTFSRVTLAVSAGQTCYLRIAGYNGARGAAKVNIGSFAALCAGDFNLDGRVNTADITAYLSAWFEARASGINGRADVDGSGTVNTADITAFLSSWFADRASGCGE